MTYARKYSPANSRVKVRAEIARDPKYLEITIEDNGIGISPEHQKMIFERFYRIENQVHTIKGTGLGLHLVKIAIEKHHQGKVFVKSKLNEGSTFGFWLPLEEADVKDISLKELKERSLNQIEITKNTTYQEYEIKKIEDYNKKTQLDNEFIGNNQEQNDEEELEKPAPLIFEEIKNENIEQIIKDNPIKKIKDIPSLEETKKENEEWEITFEVRDN